MTIRECSIALGLPLLVAFVTGCATGASSATQRETPRSVAVVNGFVAPEAVRYDPDQDVYFVSNWGTGPSGALDNNGFIARMHPDGGIETMRFIAGGTNGVTLHAPRGMYIVGDTLWVADVNAVRGFHRRTGALLASVDFTAVAPGFLNDVAADADGAIYVTDTPRNRVYRVHGGPTLVVSDTTLGSPNGITWDAANRRFLILPFNGGHTIHSWTPAPRTWGTSRRVRVRSSMASRFCRAGGCSFRARRTAAFTSSLAAPGDPSSMRADRRPTSRWIRAGIAWPYRSSRSIAWRSGIFLELADGYLHPGHDTRKSSARPIVAGDLRIR